MSISPSPAFYYIITLFFDISNNHLHMTLTFYTHIPFHSSYHFILNYHIMYISWHSSTHTHTHNFLRLYHFPTKNHPATQFYQTSTTDILRTPNRGIVQFWHDSFAGYSYRPPNWCVHLTWTKLFGDKSAPPVAIAVNAYPDREDHDCLSAGDSLAAVVGFFRRLASARAARAFRTAWRAAAAASWSILMDGLSGTAALLGW